MPTVPGRGMDVQLTIDSNIQDIVERELNNLVKRYKPKSALALAMNPNTAEEVLEQKLLREEVYAALMQLTAIQARRIYARFYLGMTVAEIARIEGADRRRVWESIRRGLKKLARLLDTAQ